MENFSCCYFVILWIDKKPIFYICLCFANVFATSSFVLCFGIGICVKLVALIIHDTIYDARASYLLFLFAYPQLMSCDLFFCYSSIVNCQSMIYIFYLSIIFICQSIILLSIFSAKLNDQVRVITSYGNVFSFFSVFI